MLVLKALAVIAVVAIFIYGKYYQMRWIESRKDRKADVETLFDGRK